MYKYSLCLLAMLCTSAYASQLQKHSIKLDGSIEGNIVVCNDTAYFKLTKERQHPVLYRINLSDLTTEKLNVVDYFETHFACNQSGYYIANPLQKNGELTSGVAAYQGHELRWQFNFAPEVVDPIVQQLVVTSNYVFITVFHFRSPSHSDLPDDLIALDSHTGKQLWQQTLTLTSPKLSVSNHTLYLRNYKGKLEARSLKNGELKWHVDGKEDEGYFAPQLDSKTNTLLTGFGDTGSSYEESNIIGLDPENGKVKWRIADEKFTILSTAEALKGDFVYGHTLPAKINWYELSIPSPVLRYQWKEPYTEMNGELAQLVRVGNQTLAVFESSYAHQRIVLFDNQGKKQDEIIFPVHTLIKLKPVVNKTLFFTDSGEIGLLSTS